MSEGKIALLLWLQGVGVGVSLATPFRSTGNWIGATIVLTCSLVFFGGWLRGRSKR